MKIFAFISTAYGVWSDGRKDDNFWGYVGFDAELPKTFGAELPTYSGSFHYTQSDNYEQSLNKFYDDISNNNDKEYDGIHFDGKFNKFCEICPITYIPEDWYKYRIIGTPFTKNRPKEEELEGLTREFYNKINNIVKQLNLEK